MKDSEQFDRCRSELMVDDSNGGRITGNPELSRRFSPSLALFPYCRRYGNHHGNGSVSLIAKGEKHQCAEHADYDGNYRSLPVAVPDQRADGNQQRGKTRDKCDDS